MNASTRLLLLLLLTALMTDGASLIPRQKVTAPPYALLATGLASGSVGGGSIDPTEVQLRRKSDHDQHDYRFQRQ